jgi:hypothetical protein
MMSMEQIHRIKELQVQQKGPYQIAKELGVDPKTVRHNPYPQGAQTNHEIGHASLHPP